jgi:hypothetical protein
MTLLKITFNGELVGYVLAEFIDFVPSDDPHHHDDEDYLRWHKEITALDSHYIKTELIDKGDTF